MFSNIKNKTMPLAEALRPQKLAEVVGQKHLLSENGALFKMVNGGYLSSFILWGPAGCGKTTVAKIIAAESSASFEQISAVFSGVAELKKIFNQAEINKEQGKQTVLFVDEIHRFNKAQQDAFLPVIENGTIILIGATTENPSFELNSALLSRCQVFVLNALSEDDLKEIIIRAEDFYKQKLPIDSESYDLIYNMAGGDGRFLLNIVEAIFKQNPSKELTKDNLQKIITARAPVYDKKADGHYNLISALHKSIRGSDADAAMYWLARMLNAGEDPHYILRRLNRFAFEDIGLAEPEALDHAVAAWQAFERIGMPEGELVIAQLVVYLAICPKSNSVYKAYPLAKKKALQTANLMPPKHILNAPTKLMKDMGYSDGYVYDHDTLEGLSGQNYFPDETKREKFFFPIERGFEREIVKRINYFEKIRSKKNG